MAVRRAGDRTGVFAEEIRADAYPSDAATAVEVAGHLLG